MLAGSAQHDAKITKNFSPFPETDFHKSPTNLYSEIKPVLVLPRGLLPCFKHFAESFCAALTVAPRDWTPPSIESK